MCQLTSGDNKPVLNTVSRIKCLITNVKSTAVTHLWIKLLKVFLFSSLVSFSSISAAAPGAGVTLVNNLQGTFGTVTEAMNTEVTRILQESGLEDAAIESEAVLVQISNGEVPVISDLSDPFQNDVEGAMSLALSKVQTATNILNKIKANGAQQALQFIAESPLFEGADFGLTLPNGRLRVIREGLEVSICLTRVGAFGSVIINGISNAKQLCNVNEPRMANPTKSLLAFNDLAIGHTHIRTNRILLPNITADLTLLPAPIEAETYIKINDQWVQIRLAGSDPKSLEVEAKLEVGVKGGVSYTVQAEIEGKAAVKIKLKPLYATEVIRGASQAMADQALLLGQDMNDASEPDTVAIILKAGLDYLSQVESQFEDVDGGFGETSIEVTLIGGIGVGIWDTGISGISATDTVALKMPLAATVAITSGTLERYVDIAMSMSNAGMNLSTAILEGKVDTELAAFASESQSAFTTFAEGVLVDILAISTKIELEASYKLALLGEADSDSIDLYGAKINVPIGNISETLQTKPNAIGDSVSAASYLLLSAINPDVVIDEAVWGDLSLGVIPEVKYTLKAINPLTFKLVTIKDVSLLDTLTWMTTSAQSMRNVFLSVIQSADENSLAPLRTAIEDAVATGEQLALDILNKTTISLSRELAANGQVGAEGVIKLGAGIKIETEIKTSLILLILDNPAYKQEDQTVLSKVSIPIDLSLGAGAAVGEGVELTVNAGGSLTFNLFELTAKHWDGPLPTPASIYVAGFPVLEFIGQVNQDESIDGGGFLMLPMGGIVESTFALDEIGNVELGIWSGGIDLGPLGYYPLIAGAVDNDGIRGEVDTDILGSPLKIDYLLTSSGLLFGSYEGALVIAGQRFVSVDLSLGQDGLFSGSALFDLFGNSVALDLSLMPDGQFSGLYKGNINLAGLDTDTVLMLDNDGFSGSGTMNILGSELISSNLRVSSSGQVSGTFTGEIQAGTHTLSSVSLDVVSGGLVGTAIMDLPGALAAVVKLQVINGKVMATFEGSLLDGLSSQGSMLITQGGINFSASLDASQFATISSQVLDLAKAAALQAQANVADAQAAVNGLQADVDSWGAQIEAARAEVLADIEQTKQGVIVAEQNAQTALNELNAVIDQINALQNTYDSLIAAATIEVNDAQSVVDGYQAKVNFYKTKIAQLDSWYSNLSTFNKAYYSAYYTAERARLVALRGSNQTLLTAAKVTLAVADSALALLQSELADQLNPLEITRAALQITYDEASAALVIARDALLALEVNPDLDPRVAVLIVEQEAARLLLTAALKTLTTLNSAISMADYIAMQGSDTAFKVLFASFNADLNVLLQSGSFEVSARVVYLGQQGVFTLAFNTGEPVDSFYQALLALQSAQSLLNKDILPPTVIAETPPEWQSAAMLIHLIASDEMAGSGIASITFSATGAKTIPETTVSGDAATVLIDGEGITTLIFYTTDVNGNVSGKTFLNSSIDSSAPQINIELPADDTILPYDIVITANDLGSAGISYLAISASGAESIVEQVYLVGSTVVALATPGKTLLFITAVDVAGNSTTITQEMIVPEIIQSPDDTLTTDIEPADTNAGIAASGSGGSIDPLFILMLSIMLLLRSFHLRLRSH